MKSDGENNLIIVIVAGFAFFGLFYSGARAQFFDPKVFEKAATPSPAPSSPKAPGAFNRTSPETVPSGLVISVQEACRHMVGLPSKAVLTGQGDDCKAAITVQLAAVRDTMPPWKKNPPPPEKRPTLETWFKVPVTVFASNGTEKSGFLKKADGSPETIDKDKCGVALPYNFSWIGLSDVHVLLKAPAGKDEAGNPTFRYAVAKVVDFGPHNLRDPYWLNYRANLPKESFRGQSHDFETLTWNQRENDQRLDREWAEIKAQKTLTGKELEGRKAEISKLRTRYATRQISGGVPANNAGIDMTLACYIALGITTANDSPERPQKIEWKFIAAGVGGLGAKTPKRGEWTGGEAAIKDYWEKTPEALAGVKRALGLRPLDPTKETLPPNGETVNYWLALPDDDPILYRR